VVDSLNFCFWLNGITGFEYENITKNLANIMDSDPEFFKPQNLSKVSAKYLKEKVFDNLEFGLLNERTRILNEVGTVICYEYQSSFIQFLEESKYDAPRLVR